MREFMILAKSLADGNRLRALMVLRGGELCACQLCELLGLAPSTLSRHMFLLHGAGLVDSRKDGRWVYYRRAGDDGREPPPMVAATFEWLDACLAGDRDLGDDLRVMAEILLMPREQLCKGKC